MIYYYFFSYKVINIYFSLLIFFEGPSLLILYSFFFVDTFQSKEASARVKNVLFWKRRLKKNISYHPEIFAGFRSDKSPHDEDDRSNGKDEELSFAASSKLLNGLATGSCSGAPVRR